MKHFRIFWPALAGVVLLASCSGSGGIAPISSKPAAGGGALQPAPALWQFSLTSPTFDEISNTASGPMRIYVTSYTTGSITTYTGNGSQTTPTITGLNSPHLAAVDLSGKIYVANSENYSVNTYKKDGTPTTPTITAGMSYPVGVAVDAAGKIYVSQYFSNSVTTYTKDGIQTTPTITAGVSVPAGVAVDKNGKIYVTNQSSNRVTTYTKNGIRTTPTITVGISGPQDVAVDGNGKIYVANSANGTVTTYTKNGTQTTPTITAGLSGPNSLKVDGNGKIYVSNSYTNSITTFTKNGTQTTPTITAGISGAAGVALELFTTTIGIRLNGEISFNDPNYGFELGYAVGTQSTQTQTISLNMGELVLFQNVDTLPHSAAFLGNATANNAPWPGSFNGSTTQSPAGTAIGTTGWATGSLNPSKKSPVYETGSPGFYMIGCQYHYNTNKMRTVIVVH
ncbi:MAG TPA: NHL repeat-containing protein [Candidatus Eremiobacteraceae bacterium]